MNLRLHLERKGPLVVALLVAIAHGWCYRKWYPCGYPDSDRDLFSNVVNLSGIAVGFLATGQALLFSLTDSFVVKTLKQLNQFDRMMENFTVAIRACLVVAVFTLGSYLWSFKTVPYLFSAWLGLVSYATLTSLRVLYHLGETLHGRR